MLGYGFIVKFPKKGQDLRIDLPTIGKDTLKQCKLAKIKGISCQTSNKGAEIVAVTFTGQFRSFARITKSAFQNVYFILRIESYGTYQISFPPLPPDLSESK